MPTVPASPTQDSTRIWKELPSASKLVGIFRCRGVPAPFGVDGSAFCGAQQKKKVFSTRENDAASVASPTH
jgi:hypothetical protein